MIDENMNAIRLVKNTRKASKADLESTLEYFQGGLALARLLEDKLDNMPLAIRFMLEEKGVNLGKGKELSSIFTIGCDEILAMMDMI